MLWLCFLLSDQAAGWMRKMQAEAASFCMSKIWMPHFEASVNLDFAFVTAFVCVVNSVHSLVCEMSLAADLQKGFGKQCLEICWYVCWYLFASRIPGDCSARIQVIEKIKYRQEANYRNLTDLDVAHERSQQLSEEFCVQIRICRTEPCFLDDWTWIYSGLVP